MSTTACGIPKISIEPEVPGNCNLVGADLKVTVPVRNLSESAVAADGAKDNPRMFSSPDSPSWGKLLRIWRNWSTVMRLGMLEILKASPFTLRLATVSFGAGEKGREGCPSLGKGCLWISILGISKATEW